MTASPTVAESVRELPAGGSVNFCGDSIMEMRAVQPHDGGSIPTSPLQRLVKREWNVAGCSEEKAVNLITDNHYARGVAKQSVYIHGLYPSDWHWYEQCVGVAWWLPPTKAAAFRLAKDKWEGVLALSRLAVEPDVPANACSFLISKSVRMIDRRRWHTLVAYADTWRGHTGSIYRACGWQYDGMTRPTETWVIGGRLVAMKAGPKTRTVAEMKAIGAEFLGRFPKHRYVLRLPSSPAHEPKETGG